MSIRPGSCRADAGARKDANADSTRAAPLAILTPKVLTFFLQPDRSLRRYVVTSALSVLISLGGSASNTSR